MGSTMGQAVRTDLKVAHMPIIRVLPKPQKAIAENKQAYGIPPSTDYKS